MNKIGFSDEQIIELDKMFQPFYDLMAGKKTGVKYPVNWQKVADASKVTLLDESNLDRNDPQSLMYQGNPNED